MIGSPNSNTFVRCMRFVCELIWGCLAHIWTDVNCPSRSWLETKKKLSLSAGLKKISVTSCPRKISYRIGKFEFSPIFDA